MLIKTIQKLVLPFVFTLVAPLSFGLEWSSYTSDNFVIYSDDQPREIISLLEDFEVYRVVSLTLLGLPNESENQKMVIIKYDSSREYNKANLPRGAAGYYINTDAGPRMVIGPTGRLSNAKLILFHEYIHYLLSEHSNIIYPKWYSEGLAEVFSTANIRRNRVRIGDINQNRADFLRFSQQVGIERLISLDQVVPEDRQSGFYEGRFYATAWLFVHYLQINSYEENPELKQQTAAYLNAFNRGIDPEQAFMESYGITPDEMSSRLRGYQSSNAGTRVTWSPAPEYTGGIQQELLLPNTINYVLAHLVLNFGEDEAALEYLQSIDEQGENANRAYSLRSIIHNHLDYDELAEQDIDFALAENTEDSFVLTNLAHVEMDNYLKAEENGNQNIDTLIKVEDYTKRALENDPENLSALYFLGQSYLKQDKVISALETMLEQHSLFPSSPTLNLDIAKLLINEDRADLARRYASLSLASFQSEWQRQIVEGLIGQIDSGQIDISILDPIYALTND
ncbi:MAG: hypothetical protein COA71_01020 [SAR86 cluster bacterium]|uniref:DUF1570 domain-containing protein n=1 Tax=SAR86 cluster bacterium TaxID=2030880 RepID=A0A2A5CHW9_9GAMM|nr:DUF1570 domain-containing protein [Gammaproteobacteria bacterium AH-315-E17]PCJ43484.1 MAG: hypothetical protein COA71_01020 [SAR86 cluster bacterium]